jgi:hypothetical protein
MVEADLARHRANMRLSHRRILMTGATGFVGRHLLPLLEASLPEAECSLDTSMLPTRAPFQNWCTTCNLMPVSILRRSPRSPADARQDPDRAWHFNLHGTLNVARAALAQAPGVRLQRGDRWEVVRERPAAGRDRVASSYCRHCPLDRPDRVGARPHRCLSGGWRACATSLTWAAPMSPACAANAELAPDAALNIASGVPHRIGDILRELLDLAGVNTELVADTARLRDPERERRQQSGAPTARLGAEHSVATDACGRAGRLARAYGRLIAL